MENWLNPKVVMTLFQENTDMQTPGVAFKSRITRYYEIEIILGGSGRMYVDGIEHILKRGDCFFRKPGTHIQGIMPYGYLLIIFEPCYVKKRDFLYSEGRRALGETNAKAIEFPD